MLHLICVLVKRDTTDTTFGKRVLMEARNANGENIFTMRAVNLSCRRTGGTGEMLTVRHRSNRGLTRVTRVAKIPPGIPLCTHIQNIHPEP